MTGEQAHEMALRRRLQLGYVAIHRVGATAPDR